MSTPDKLDAPWRTNREIKRLCLHCGGIQFLQSKWGVGQRWKDVNGCGRRDEYLPASATEPSKELVERRNRAHEWAEATGEGPGEPGYIRAWLAGYFNHPQTSSKPLEVMIIEEFEALFAAQPAKPAPNQLPAPETGKCPKWELPSEEEQIVEENLALIAANKERWDNAIAEAEERGLQMAA